MSRVWIMEAIATIIFDRKNTGKRSERRTNSLTNQGLLLSEESAVVTQRDDEHEGLAGKLVL